MNAPRTCWLAAFCLLAATGIALPASALPTVRVGIYQNSPKVGLSESGQPEGIFVDLIAAIAAEEGWDLEYVPGTWAEGLDRLAAGKIDLMPDMAFSTERAELFAFHREPVLSDWFQIFARRGSGIRALLDLKGKRVAVLAHSIQQDVFEKMAVDFGLEAALIPFPDFARAFSAVADGEADAVISNPFYGATHLRGGRIEDTAIVFHPSRLFFAAPRAGNPALLDAIDRRLKEMKANPSSVFYRSLRHWTSDEIGFRLPPWLKGAGIAAAALLLFSLAWSAILKSQVSARTRELKSRNKEIERLYQTVRESEERFRSFVENANDIVFTLSLDGVLNYVSPNWKEILGHDTRDVVGRYFGDFVHPEDLPACLAAMEHNRNGQKQSGLEYRVRHRDGSWRWFFTNGALLHGPGGDFHLGIARDNTERKRGEERLRLHAQLLDSVRESVVASDLDGRILYWGRGAEQLYGFAAGEVMGKPYRDFAGAAAPPDEKAFRRELIEKGSWSGEHVQKNRRGETFWTSTFVSVVLDEQGNPAGFVGIDRNIDERKRAEEKREQLESRLAQAQKMESVGRLAGGIAHDFNNMLGAILGYAELMLDHLEPQHPHYADLLEIRKAAERSADLTRQLLAFARQQPSIPRPIDLNATVVDMLHMLRRLIGEDIPLSWTPGKNLWLVRMDPSQVDQILANLCVNARDAIAGEGRISIETANVRVEASEVFLHPDRIPGEYAQLTVSDTGIGMDKETLGKLFEPFFTTMDLGRGSGLGLATVYGLVRQNNGFIEAESVPGQGNVFRVFLPRLVQEPS